MPVPNPILEQHIRAAKEYAALVDAYKAAIEKYGDHTKLCHYDPRYIATGDCTCGFKDVLDGDLSGFID
jgi:hypothetical protein